MSLYCNSVSLLFSHLSSLIVAPDSSSKLIEQSWAVCLCTLTATLDMSLSASICVSLTAQNPDASICETASFCNIGVLTPFVNLNWIALSELLLRHEIPFSLIFLLRGQDSRSLSYGYWRWISYVGSPKTYSLIICGLYSTIDYSEDSIFGSTATLTCSGSFVTTSSPSESSFKCLPD